MSVRLFVGNLPYEASEAELREHFSTVGPLRQVFLPIDRDTGRPRGFAFVEFEDADQAQEAIRRLNNQPFKGRNLAVNEARARESRPAGEGYSRPPGPPPPPGDFNRAAGAGPAGRRELRPARRSAAGGGGGGAKDRRNQKYDKPKGPIRERVRGQLFTTEDMDDSSGPEPDIDNFATSAPERAHDDEDEGADR